jgi:hypothetical protein
LELNLHQFLKEPAVGVIGASVPACPPATPDHPAPAPALPEDSAARKAIPMARGLLDYFPAALAAVAELSKAGNDKHNPGEPMHHARGKSSDHADCIMRHLVDRGATYTEMIQGEPVVLRHSAALAWRALALLQEELEAAGAPRARGAR